MKTLKIKVTSSGDMRPSPSLSNTLNTSINSSDDESYTKMSSFNLFTKCLWPKFINVKIFTTLIFFMWIYIPEKYFEPLYTRNPQKWCHRCQICQHRSSSVAVVPPLDSSPSTSSPSLVSPSWWTLYHTHHNITNPIHTD